MRTCVRFTAWVSCLLCVLTGLSLAQVLTLPDPATAGPAASVSCGDTITTDTTLTADLIDCVGDGLIIGADNITLDCDGHTIDGTGQPWTYGIVLGGRSWDIINNCVVTDFGWGIRLDGSNNNSLTGNTASSNYYDGIAFLGSWSNANTLTGNTTTDNGADGVFLAGSDNTLTGNTIRDNIGNGVEVYGGSNNTIYNNTIRNNAGTGLAAPGSNNALNSNVVCSNKLDISNTGSNYGDDNTCESTNNWNDTGTEACTFSCPLEPVCYCATCSECNEKLAADCPVVKLTADIVDQSGGCINQGTTFNGEVFDCQGYTIDGTGQPWTYGIVLGGRSWDTINNCVVTDFGWGIRLDGSNNNSLTGNTASSNYYDGIAFLGSWSNANTLTGNTTRDNGGDGVFLAGSDNTLTGNTIRDNIGNGVEVYGGSNNTIYNNYLSNARNAVSGGTNTWNIAKTPGTNILGGPYLGGNYWSDYTGVDTNGDGLGDTNVPYNASGNIQNGGDYAPLVPVTGPVGGIAELPNVSAPSSPNHVRLVALAAVAAGALTVGWWYVRKRWPT